MISVPASSHRKWLTPAILLLAAGLFSFQVVDLINFGIDDLFIVLRVCVNVLAGFGFVYNRGEFIEGYSDWLWVVLLLPILSVLGTGDAMSAMWAAKSLSLCFGLLTLVMLFLLTLEFFREREDRRVIAALAVLALASSAPFAAWSVGALETTLCAFLFSFALWVILRSDRSSNGEGYPALGICAGIVLALSLLTRPEAVLHVGVLVAALAFLVRWKVKSLLAIVLPIVVIFGAFLIWRWQTYHALLPNTFTAKTGGAAGGLFLGLKYYLASLASILGPLLLPFAFGFLWFNAERRKLVLILTFVVSTTIFTIYAGGDWMPAARFLIPVAPMFILIAVRGAVLVFDFAQEKLLLEKRWSVIAIAVCIAVPLANVFSERVLLRAQLPTIESGFNARTGHALPDHERVANWIHTNFPNQIVVAAGEAGMIGYLNSQMRLIDCGGLMDTAIARDRKAGRGFNAERVLAAKPDLVLLYGMNGIDRGLSAAPAVGAYTQSFLNDPNFRAGYHQAQRYGEFAIYARNP